MLIKRFVLFVFVFCSFVSFSYAQYNLKYEDYDLLNRVVEKVKALSPWQKQSILNIIPNLQNKYWENSRMWNILKGLFFNLQLIVNWWTYNTKDFHIWARDQDATVWGRYLFCLNKYNEVCVRVYSLKDVNDVTSIMNIVIKDNYGVDESLNYNYVQTENGHRDEKRYRFDLWDSESILISDIVNSLVLVEIQSSAVSPCDLIELSEQDRLICNESLSKFHLRFTDTSNLKKLSLTK